jgi:hypothetical protein
VCWFDTIKSANDKCERIRKSELTSDAFTGVLNREGITISMDGRGRAFDNIFVERLWRNVKHEDVYLKGYSTMIELTVGLAEYFTFYNSERPHQSLGQETPDVVYKTAMGGGAVIVDKYPRAVEGTPVPLRSTGVPQPRSLYQKYQQRLNRGSADQLRLKLNVQLKLSGFLSWLRGLL